MKIWWRQRQRRLTAAVPPRSGKLSKIPIDLSQAQKGDGDCLLQLGSCQALCCIGDQLLLVGGDDQYLSAEARRWVEALKD